jgi:thiol-disulfide isomerase/thioredoxin
MSIIFLGRDDFAIRNGDRGRVLSLIYESMGLTFILFYSTECSYCSSVISVFKQLPNHVSGCRFAMLNVDMYKSVAEMSRDTIAPITHVPDLILYVNGYPYVRYEGSNSIESVRKFIFEMNEQINKTSFVEPPAARPSAVSPVEKPATTAATATAALIPAYTIGTPLYGSNKRDNVCYLNFTTAYVQ